MKLELDKKCDYISQFTRKISSRVTQSFTSDIGILLKFRIIDECAANRLDKLYYLWFNSTINANDSNEFNLMINLMYKAIEEYEAK
jgi:hypothetical protein